MVGQEIERKYLVDHHKWQALEKPVGEVYRQGYLLTDPKKTIRVRLTENTAFLTIKGLTVSATRPEYEYEIPPLEAKELLDNFSTSELSKIRYKIKHGNKTWEVDQFLGSNLGLIIAEVELASEDENFAMPDWVIKEVTTDAKYYNANLSLKPYKEW